MRLEITLTNEETIELDLISNFDDIKEIKDNIGKVLNNNGNYIRFSNNLFNRELMIKKEMILSIEIWDI